MATAKRQGDASNDTPSLAGSARESERDGGFRAVGVAASKLAAPIVTRRGGGVLVRLKSEWLAIIGADWAAVTWPSALGRDGVLKLRASSTAALELQHRTPLLIESINLFFGRAVVRRRIHGLSQPRATRRTSLVPRNAREWWNALPRRQAAERGVRLQCQCELWRWIGLRGEIRDFYSGTPAYNISGTGAEQHNIVAGGGFVLKWGE